MKPLIIAEKPSAARAIADALGGFRAAGGYLEGPDYLIAWAVGHLVTLYDAEDYNPRWKRWSLADLPLIPEQYGLKLLPRAAGQFNLIAGLARQCAGLVNACDAGREGELVFGYIYQMLGTAKPVQRLWLSSLTRAAIREAMGQLRPGTEFRRLYAAAECRSRGDWLVGINATRAFTCRFAELLSVGRVQTPTLALLVRREREIAAFVPEQYWEITATFATAPGHTYPGRWFGPDGSRLPSAEAAAAITAAADGRPGRVESVEQKSALERPPLLYDLTEMQREANRRFGLTAAATLKAAQDLYEARLITYPRTDSRFLSRHVAVTLPGLLQRLGTQEPYAALVGGAQPGLVHPGNRRVVDDTKVTDHHAIIPTGEVPRTAGGSAGKIYDLVVRRFLAQYYPDARYQDTLVVTAVAGADAATHRFRTRARLTLDPGWRLAEPSPATSRSSRGAAGSRGRGASRVDVADAASTPVSADEEGASGEPVLRELPPLAHGEAVTTHDIAPAHKETQPPRRLTEAALLSAMETAGKAMTDETLRAAMKGRGLGTPATRAAIIERLKQVGYVDTQGRQLLPTVKGMLLVQMAEQAGSQALLSAEMTAEWEQRIAGIQAGEYDPDQFMAGIRDLTTQVVKQVRSAVASTVASGSQATSGNPVAGASPSPLPGSKPAARRGGRATAAVAVLGGKTEAVGEAPLPPAGPCPRCRQPVVHSGRAWACQGGCGWQLPVRLCRRDMHWSDLAALLGQGQTEELQGFVSRNGKPFSARLRLDGDRLQWEFPPRPPRRGRTTGPRAGQPTPQGEPAKPAQPAKPVKTAKPGGSPKAAETRAGRTKGTRTGTGPAEAEGGP